ncbi:hypothetical protein FO519_004048 [Halicephalobus sp. NKZ332]|nr:hypothetical protein FO519_004048 [Halicephalobus sp. NKZ332]
MEDPAIKKEMTGICNFEIRYFKWDFLPENVKELKIFSWKVLLIAQLLNEFNTFFYMDSSIYLETGNFTVFWELINNRTLTSFQMSGATGHSIRHATHRGMYEYVPLDMTIDRYHDMLEANMMIIHRDEPTKEIIKWALLCGITRDCIQPEGINYTCTKEGVNILSHVNPRHPKNTAQRHQTRRLQGTLEKIDNCVNS